MSTPTLRPAEDLADYTAFLITEVARLYRTSFDKHMKPMGLERSEWWLLNFLVYFNGGTQQALTEVMDLTKGGMGKLIDRMEERGFVRREPCKDDRRSNRVVLTQAGWDLAVQVDAEGVKTGRQSVSMLTADEIAALNGLLKKIRAGFVEREAGSSSP